MGLNGLGSSYLIVKLGGRKGKIKSLTLGQALRSNICLLPRAMALLGWLAGKMFKRLKMLYGFWIEGEIHEELQGGCLNRGFSGV